MQASIVGFYFLCVFCYAKQGFCLIRRIKHIEKFNQAAGHR